MRRIYFVGVISLATTLLLGCGRQEEKTTTGSIEKAKPGAAEIDANVQAEIKAKLAKADKLDGTTDKIVHRCASCALGMDGKSEHRVAVSGYTLHFCSVRCKERFTENLTASILDLKIPEN